MRNGTSHLFHIFNFILSIHVISYLIQRSSSKINILLENNTKDYVSRVDISHFKRIVRFSLENTNKICGVLVRMRDWERLKSRPCDSGNIKGKAVIKKMREREGERGLHCEFRSCIVETLKQLDIGIFRSFRLLNFTNFLNKFAPECSRQSHGICPFLVILACHWKFNRLFTKLYILSMGLANAFSCISQWLTFYNFGTYRYLYTYIYVYNLY